MPKYVTELPETKQGVYIAELGLNFSMAVNVRDSCEVIEQWDKQWVITHLDGEHCTLMEVSITKTEAETPKDVKQPIKSDGGSSSYYDLPIPEWVLDKLIERKESTGQAFIKTEECIEVFFDNDFDYGNQFKSQVRSYGTEQGGGKKFNNVSYEQSKIKYSADKIIELSERRKIK